MPALALTSAERQARRLALYNDKCRAAGWGSWRELVTAIINGVVTVPRKPRPARARKQADKPMTEDERKQVELEHIAPMDYFG